MRSKATTILILLSAIGGLFVLFGGLSLAQSEGTIAYGDTVSGEVTNRFGQEWTFQGCQDDVITLTVQSMGFSPFLALSDSTTEDFLVEGGSSDTSAEISAFPLAASGTYTAVVAGSSIRDRGPYSLTLSLSGTASATGTDLPQVLPGQAVTGEVTSRFGGEWSLLGCANDVVSITVESGDFAPYLEFYGPTGRDPLATSPEGNESSVASIGAYLLPEAGIYTIIAAGQNIADRGVYTLLVASENITPVTSSVTSTANNPATATPTSTPAQVAAANPVRTPTFTPTPSPSPSPLPPQAPPRPEQPEELLPVGIVILANGTLNGLEGTVRINPDYVVRQDVIDGERFVVIRDRLSLELYVYDPGDDPNVEHRLGDGIERVEFSIDCSNAGGGEYFREERMPRYCSFGGGEPNCNVVRFEIGGGLPDSNCPVEDVDYPVSINAYRRNSDNSGNWNFIIHPFVQDGGQDTGDVTEEPPVDVTEEPPSDVTEEPPVDITEEPPVDITEEPPVDVTEEPPVDITEEPPADITEEPPADVTEEPPADVTDEPPADVTEEPPADITEEPPADTIDEPPADVTDEPPADTVDEPPADITEEPPADVPSEPPADTGEGNPGDGTEANPGGDGGGGTE
jgi:hypothetical protein